MIFYGFAGISVFLLEPALQGLGAPPGCLSRKINRISEYRGICDLVPFLGPFLLSVSVITTQLHKDIAWAATFEH